MIAKPGKNGQSCTTVGMWVGCDISAWILKICIEFYWTCMFGYSNITSGNFPTEHIPNIYAILFVIAKCYKSQPKCSTIWYWLSKYIAFSRLNSCCYLKEGARFVLLRWKFLKSILNLEKNNVQDIMNSH